MMQLSVIIISWNSGEVLHNCIKSLSEVFDCDDVELIRVDNGSNDGSESFPTEESVIKLGENYGVAYARNRGIEKAKGKYVLLLDDDTEATVTSIQQMVDYMESHKDVGLCALPLVDGEGNVQKSYKECPGLVLKVRNVLKSLLSDKKDDSTKLPIAEMEPFYLIGACQMIRREAIDTVGLLDEKIFYGPEDADFCMRLRNNGWRVVLIQGEPIIHHWRHISRRNPFSRISRLHIKALLYFYFKHKRIL